MNRLITCSMDLSHERKMIACIKGMRGLTKMGLQDSKHFVESLIHGSKNIQIDELISDDQVSKYIEQVQKGGMVITIVKMDTPVRREIAKQLTDILMYATLSNQTDVMNTLSNLLNNHLPDFNKEETNE